MTLIDLAPLIKMYERLHLENLALRELLDEKDDWSKEDLNKKKEKLASVVSPQFALLVELLDKPQQFREVLEGILQVDKQN